MSGMVIDMLKQRYSSDTENSYVGELDGISVYHPRSPDFAGIDDFLKIDAVNDPGGKTYRIVADGYRPDWWFNVRASNNEPLLRINFECSDPSRLQSGAKAVIDAVHAFCTKNGARVEIDSPGNLTLELA
ncbi:MAG: hypothetical protein R3B90_18095 [Planctomycetaceae bacterium]